MKPLLRAMGRWGLATAMVATVLQVAGTAPAQADPIVVLIQSPPIHGGTGSEPPLIVSRDLGTGTITVDNPGGTAPTTQQCVEAITSETFCLGTSDGLLYPHGTDIGPISITDAPTQEGGLPGTALDWILDDAISSVAQLHGVRSDDLVRSFARPQVRAFVAMRINDILNKKLYGVPLTNQESAAYDALEEIYKARLVSKAKRALREYEQWSNSPCLYFPPAPPAGSNLPVVPNPVQSTETCSAVGAFTQTYKMVRGTPPVSTFDAWASYRNPSPLTAHAGDPNLERMMAETLASHVSLAGLGIAAAVGVGTAVTVVALNLAFVAVWIADAWFHVITFTLAAGGVLAVVAAVVIAAIIAGIAIWKIIEDAQPGLEIRRRVTEALANDDPFGIQARQADYAGLDYLTLEEPEGQPPALIHEQSFTRQLASNTYEWMMFDGDGDLVVDPITGWNSAGATEADDLKFVDDQDVVRDPLIVLAPDGTEDSEGRAVNGYRVKVARGWLLVSTLLAGEQTFGPYVPRLNIKYDDGGDEPAMMSLFRNALPGEPEGTKFLHTKAGSDQTLLPVTSNSWTLKTLGGAMTTVTLEKSEPVLPQVSVVPSIEGNLVADNLVELQSNLSDPGQGTGGTFEWEIQRLDDEGAVAQTIPPPAGNLTGFQTRLATPGRYRVVVSYDDQDPVPLSASGRIEFTILPPSPELMTAEIKDDRVLNGSLSLDLRLLQDTPSDTFDVMVEWADDALGSKAVEHYTVQCVDTGFDTCDTGPLIVPEEAPVNPQWSESPTFLIADDQDYLPHITVTITNGYGTEMTRVFPITGDHRPEYATMTPYAEMPAGTFTRVNVVEVFPSPLLVESQELTILPYVQSIADQLPEGVHPGIEERDGRWYLQIAGEPQADAIGPYTFYFPFEQEPIGMALRPPPALATLEIKAAIEPGYRGVLRGTPTEFLDRQYRNEYPDYSVQVAQVLAEDEEDFTDFTGTVKCKLTAGPTTVFDKACQPDAPFPWPEEKITDTLEASVYLESSTQPLSDDGPYSVNLGTRFTEPVVTQVAGPDGFVRFQLVIRDLLPVQPPFSGAGYSVACSQDGGPFAPCLDSGTMDLPQTFGQHTLDVRVTAPDAAVSIERVTWDGGTPPPPPPPPAPALHAAVTALPSGPSALKQTFVLAVEHGTTVAPPYSSHGYAVSCVLDGGTATACFDDGMLQLPRVPGSHSLLVLVTAPGGAATSQRLDWKVLTPPAKFVVVAPDQPAQAGDKVTIKARHLLPREKYVLRIDGTKVDSGRAGLDGRIRDKVRIPAKAGPGKVVVKVVGATRHRSGTDKLRVTQAFDQNRRLRETFV